MSNRFILLLKEFIIITFGAVLAAAAIYFFMLPSHVRYIKAKDELNYTFYTEVLYLRRKLTLSGIHFFLQTRIGDVCGSYMIKVLT